MTKFIFVTGGVVSGLGKGITAASLGRLLKSRGLKVAAQKLDPYINVYPGTMSPFQHGEVFVTEDGAETDLDLGHYERFIDENLNQFSNLTTGRVYSNVIVKERRGKYLGKTVQVIPHITDEIKRFIYAVGQKTGADVVITGRVADPAIFMAPAIHEFGWSLEDWDKLGKGTMMGHLLECGGQVTGGYFAEPGKKDVPGVGHLGFPIVEIAEDGSFFVTKVPEAGGMVTVETCSEQIVYEIHDPENYLTPDVVADFKQVKFTEVEKDKVQVEGATGKPKTDTFKCSIGYKDCFIGDGEISYGGPGCLARAKLALDIVKERLELVAPGQFDELKFDLIGCNSLYWNPDYKYNQEPSEVRVRVAGRAKTKAVADLVPNEVEALYTNGPAGGCGAVKRTRDIVSVASILVDRNDVKPEVELFEV